MPDLPIWKNLKYPECEGCTLLNQPGPVLGRGDRREAALIYIAQNPGYHECFNDDNTPRVPMEPLVGPSGRVFNRQLFEAGIKRSELFITNQVKCLTPGNRAPTELEIGKCRHILSKELATCKSDTVVLAGATSFSANIGTYSTISSSYKPSSKLFERMGCVEVREGRKWIGTIHPAFIMWMQMFQEEAVEHLKKAWRLSGVSLPTISINTHPSDQEVREYGRLCVEANSFADDVETAQGILEVEEDDFVGADWNVTMYGASCDPRHAIVMDPHQIPIFAAVAWQHPEVTQFEHNKEYEGYYLPKYGELRNYRFDTMVAHHLLYNTSRKYLKPHCVRYYTNLPYYGRDLGEVDQRLYNAYDCITTLITGREQMRRLKADGRLWEIANRFEFPFLSIAEKWRRYGINTDVRKALFFRKICDVKLGQIEKMISDMLGPWFNWNSPKQVAELFYEKWDLPRQYNTDKTTRAKKTTVDTEAREALKRYVQLHPGKFKQAEILFQLLDIAHEIKNLGDYFNRISPDGRIHAYWKLHGAETFRLASKPNVQNWPTWSIGKTSDGVDLGSPRAVVVPDHEEDIFIATDFDQVELWTYAKIFGIKWLLEVYAKGDYIYGAAYEEVFKRPFFQVGKPRTKKYRLSTVTDLELLRAKAVPLGFLYGRLGESVAAEHRWPASEGSAMHKAWFGRNPELGKAHANIKYEMAQKRCLRPPPGYLLHYPQPKLQGLNCFGQTPSAALLKESIILIEREFAKRALPHARTVLCVHDSILTNCRRVDVVEVYEEIINPILTRPIDWLDGFRYKHEAKVGGMWDWQMKGYEEWKESRSSTSNESNETSTSLSI